MRIAILPKQVAEASDEVEDDVKGVAEASLDEVEEEDDAHGEDLDHAEDDEGTEGHVGRVHAPLRRDKQAGR